MADKIARFKQALRAKTNAKQPKGDGALGKEIQKYEVSENKESPKHESKQTSKKKVPDKHSKTEAVSNTSNVKQEPHKKRDSGEGRKENTSNSSTLRLSTHARSSKLIQRKDQTDSNNKPAQSTSTNSKSQAEPLKSKGTQEKEKHETPPAKSNNAEKPFNYIATSIHKHILAGESQPPNDIFLNLKSNLENYSQSTSRIANNTRTGSSETETSMRLSEHALQLTDAIGELFESETSAWKSSMSPPPSLFDIPTETKFHLNHDYSASSPLHSSFESNSFTSSPSFIDQPFGTKKRSYEWDDDEDDSPQHYKIPKVYSSAPTRAKNLFDDQPVGDFFGFSHSQDSFSDFSHKKLFSNFL